MIRNELYWQNRIDILTKRDEIANHGIIAKCYRALRRLQKEKS